jgi:hypothetical protein
MTAGIKHSLSCVNGVLAATEGSGNEEREGRTPELDYLSSKRQDEDGSERQGWAMRSEPGRKRAHSDAISNRAGAIMDREE